MEVAERRRGTAIVETKLGIVVVSSNGRRYTLPGGEAYKNESRQQAAIRELAEETTMVASKSKVLFHHLGILKPAYEGGHFVDLHAVCLIEATGEPKPDNEITHVAYYVPNGNIKISRTTKEIIERYYQKKAIVK